MKIAFALWVPLFLLNVRGVSVFDTALFISVVYVSWQWKMFLGMASDSLSVKIRGKRYRRHPWFVLTGLFCLLGVFWLLRLDLNSVDVWVVFFPLMALITAGGALFDMSADSFAVDVVPPEWHGRILGGVNAFGQSVGGVTAALLSPLLISIGGYKLVFISGGLTGLLAFLFLILKEPELEYERVFTKQAIAFTFTERSVFIASLLQIGLAMGSRRISNPTGGMFSLLMNEIVGGFTPQKAANITVLTLLSGIPGSIIGGWAADKWGHKRLYLASGIMMVVSGYLWMTMRRGMILWFVTLAIITNFIERMNSGGNLALMGDSTPLALSGTVFQMYMSFSWIGNVPSSLIIGYLLPRNIPLVFATLSSLTMLPLFLSRYLKTYEVAKATRV
jgi:MFS family permease